MKQQTAVEWLFIKLYETIEMKGDGKVMDALLKEAKEMEKQQQERLIDETLNAYGIINNLKTNKL
jgi:hypothetical protein